MLYFAIIIAFIIGFGLAWFVLKDRPQAQQTEQIKQLETQLAVANEKQSEAQKKVEELQASLATFSKAEKEAIRIQSQLESQLKAEQDKLSHQEKDLAELQKRFSDEFKNLAQNILEEKSQKFTDQNKQNIEGLLKPLQEKIKEFQTKVEDSNMADERRNASLIEQLRSLKELNQNLGEEARSLTKALKGESKTQGNWGELQLEKILNAAGLEKDLHYSKEENFKTEDGKNQRPDYLVKLPDGKHLILDSKVSLTAYARYVEAEEEAEKALQLKAHLNSLSAHIDQLSAKNYPDLKGANSPDYVLLFVANEPALNLAFREDPQIFEKALHKNIVLVSTSTLLATLRTIGYIWRQDAQNKNAEEIAKQAGDMYDKFANFSDDLIKLGNQMATARKTYEDAMNKLTDGKGNLVRRAEKLRELGARKSNKQLDQGLIDKAHEDE